MSRTEMPIQSASPAMPSAPTSPRPSTPSVPKIYGLTNDVVFKYVFGTPGNEKLAICLLNALLGLDDPDQIVGITYINPFSAKAYPTDRGSIVDVKVTDGRGNRYFIEVQVAEQAFFAKRAVYYASKTYSEQLEAGGGFESLRKTTGISILDYVLFPDDPRVHTVYRLQETASRRELNDTIELHFVELDKVDLTKPRRTMTRFEKWMYLFRNAPVLAGGAEPLPPEFAGNEELAMTIDQVKKVNADAEMRAIIEAQERWEHDVASRLYDARQAGLKEGLEKGLEKGREEGLEKGLEKGREEGLEKGRKDGLEAGKVEMALALLDQGVDPRVIQAASGLSAARLEDLARTHATTRSRPPKP